MSLLRDAWTVARKDLRAWRRDRTGLLLGLALPLALVSVFGFLATFLYGGGSMGRTTLWLADEDRSERSAAFVAALREAETIALEPAAGEAPVSAGEVRAKVAGGDAHHALIVPAGFGAALERGELPELVLLRDPARELEDTLVRLGLMNAYMEVSQGRSWPALIGRQMRELGMPERQADSVAGAAETMRALIETWVAADEAATPAEAEPSAAASFDMSSFLSAMVPVRAEDHAPPARPQQLGYMQAQSVSGMIVMMLMFGLMACGTMLIQEREKGTLARLLAAPVARDAVLLGKVLFTALVGIFQLAVLFGCGELLFRLGTFRDPVTLVVLMLSTTAAVTGFGILVASWARTTKQAEGLSTLLILVMSCLGGAWFPLQLFAVPAVVEVVMRCTLVHWAMVGFQQMYWNQHAWTHPGTLLAIGVQWAFAAAAMLLARRFYLRRYVAARLA